MAQRLRRIRRIIFCIKMYLIQFQQKPVETRGQKGAILGKNDRLCCISSSKMWYLVRQMLYLVSKMWYVQKSGNRWYAYVSAIWVVYVVSQKKTVSPKGEFYGFSLIHLPFVSVCIRVVCTYITYLYVLFFLIILPRRIYNAVFFGRQYVKRIFFQKILIGRSKRSGRLVIRPWIRPSRNTRPHVLNVQNVWYSPVQGNRPVRLKRLDKRPWIAPVHQSSKPAR